MTRNVILIFTCFACGSLFLCLYSCADFLIYFANVSSKSPVIQCNMLFNVPTIDNGEPLALVNSDAPSILCEYVLDDMKPYLGEKIFVRKEVAARLTQANVLLQKVVYGARIKLAYGYRLPVVQKNILIKCMLNLEQDLR